MVKSLIHKVQLQWILKQHNNLFWSAVRGCHCDQPQLQVNPKQSLIDERVSIKGTNLAKNSEVTLETELKDETQRLNFRSLSHFLTDREGTFDTEKQKTLDGSSYQGAYSSGPLWSVRPERGSVKRLWPTDILKKDFQS